MSDEKGYNGWHNYETWAVALWLDNEEGSYNLCREWAEECYDEAKSHYPPVIDVTGEDDDKWLERTAAGLLADRLKDLHEENAPTVTGIYADLLNAALSEVDWYEIAEHYLEDEEESGTDQYHEDQQEGVEDQFVDSAGWEELTGGE